MKKVTYFLPGFSPDIKERFLERLIIYISEHTHTYMLGRLGWRSMEEEGLKNFSGDI
jgi:hypothetical protein